MPDYQSLAIPPIENAGLSSFLTGILKRNAKSMKGEEC
jgi:hypothetical protein